VVYTAEQLKKHRIKLGENIRNRRKWMGKSLCALAEFVGLSRSALSRIENGKQALRTEMALRLADALGVDLDQLCHGDIEDPGSWIARQRRQAGMTQADLAKTLGLKHPTSVHRLEAGKTALSRERALLIAYALDLGAIDGKTD
jgi:transcriptional regulator with XRE-family HTH domain